MKRILAGALALGWLVGATPALADAGLPPAQYDVGGATPDEAALAYHAITGRMPEFRRVPIGEGFAMCDSLLKERFGRPYPATEVTGGRTLLGCLIRDRFGGNPLIVYSHDPARPELETTIMRHELGHLLGWANNHYRPKRATLNHLFEKETK